MFNKFLNHSSQNYAMHLYETEMETDETSVRRQGKLESKNKLRRDLNRRLLIYSFQITTKNDSVKMII